MSPDPAADDFHYIYINMCVLNSPTKVFIESQWRLQEPVFWLIQCCNVLHVLNAEGASAGPNRWWPSNLPYQPRRLMILMHRRIAAYDSSCTSASWAGCMGGLIFLSSQVKPCGDGGLVGQQPSAPDPYLHQKRIECQTYILLSCQQLWNLSSKISRTLQLHLTVGVKMMDSGNLLTGVIQSVGLLGLAKTRHGLVMNYQVKPYQNQHCSNQT